MTHKLSLVSYATWRGENKLQCNKKQKLSREESKWRAEITSCVHSQKASTRASETRARSSNEQLPTTKLLMYVLWTCLCLAFFFLCYSSSNVRIYMWMYTKRKSCNTRKLFSVSPCSRSLSLSLHTQFTFIRLCSYSSFLYSFRVR